MPDPTLAEALAHLDALIADASRLPDGDLTALMDEVRREVGPLARQRGVGLVMEVRCRESLTGRDLRRWVYLLTQALTSMVETLPAGSSLRVELACVATTSGHRWLQADVATKPAHGAGDPGGRGADPPDGGRGFRLILVETALRLLEGACDRIVTADGPLLRLVAPVEA